MEDVEDPNYSILTYKIRLRPNIVSSFEKDTRICQTLFRQGKRFNKTNYTKEYKNIQNRHYHLKSNQKDRYEWYLIRRSIRKAMIVSTKIAKHSILHKKEKLSSASYNHFGKLASTIVNATIRKYQKNKKAKRIGRSVNLIVNMNGKKEAIKYQNNILTITPFHPLERYDNIPEKAKQNLGEHNNIKWNNLKGTSLKLFWKCPRPIEKINQVEFNTKYCYVNVSVSKQSLTKKDKTIGVDLNLKPSLAVLGTNFDKDFVWRFFGRNHLNTRTKYLRMRKRYQIQSKPIKLRYLNKRNIKMSKHKDAKWKRMMDIKLQRPSGKVKKIGNKESRIINDICHKTSRKIVDLAKEYDTNIAMERLSGLREAKINKKNKHWLQVFPFHNLQTKIEYKGIIDGSVVVYVNPYNTSKGCSECHSVNTCNSKLYNCQTCGNVNHRDVNAGNNIANKGQYCLDICV